MPAQIVQWLLTSAYGFLGFWLLRDAENPYERMWAALLFGFGGIWLTMKLYTWARYGRAASKSLTMDPR